MTYQVLDNGITINVSDEISVFPDKTKPTPDKDGVIMYYELLNIKESKSISWREKLGEGLKKHLKDVTIPKAILTDFPQGYKLYAHRKKYPKKKEERTDVYLFGRHKFRSPNEFIPHLIWLVSDKSGQCHCKYCNKSATINEERKVPVPSETRSKRRRNADTSDEAPKSKRMTRSSSAKDSRKRVDDNRKSYIENRRKDTSDRKKDAVYDRKKSTANNRKKISRKSSTKKRKSKTVELDDNIPPSVPKYAVFREGEIVWLVANKVLNNETLAECNKIFSIEYWPAIVGSITPQDDNESYKSTIYTVKPLILRGNENVTIDSLRPWLLYSSKESLSGNRFTRSLLNIDFDKATPDQIVEIYFKAIQKASEIVKVFTPMYQYDYLKAKGIKEKHNGIHFKAMYLGAELIYEDDVIRLLPESQSELADEENRHNETKETYLQVTSIFEDNQGFQITGDLYERGKLLEKGEHELIPKNKIDEEYTINISDIAGRFYSVYPDITESFSCELLKTFENRVLMLGDDIPPTIGPIVIPPSITVTHRDPDTPKRPKAIPPITTKQTAKRTSPLPPILTMLNDQVPFSPPQDETYKKIMSERLKIDITNTSGEIKISDEKEIITIKHTSQTSEAQDTKSIERGGSPLKFSDIEKRYTKKSDDIDLPPLVVSPDTPTFETDDEEVWGKINVNNGNDSK